MLCDFLNEGDMDDSVKRFSGGKTSNFNDDQPVYITGGSTPKSSIPRTEGTHEVEDGIPMDTVIDDGQNGGHSKSFGDKCNVCDTQTLPLDQFLVKNKDKPMIEDTGQSLEENEVAIRLVDGSGETFTRPLIPNDPRLKGPVKGLGYSPFRHGKDEKDFVELSNDEDSNSGPSQAVSFLQRSSQPPTKYKKSPFRKSRYWGFKSGEAAEEGHGQSKGTEKEPSQKELHGGKISTSNEWRQGSYNGESYKEAANEGESSKGSSVAVSPTEPVALQGAYCYLVRPAREAAVLFRAPYTAAAFWELAHELYPIAFSDVLVVLMKLNVNEARPESRFLKLREKESGRDVDQLEDVLRSLQHKEEVLVIRRFQYILVRDGREILSTRRWEFVTTGEDPERETQIRFHEIVHELLGITTEPIRIQVDRFKGEWLDYSSSMNTNTFLKNIIFKIDDNVINIYPSSWRPEETFEEFNGERQILRATKGLIHGISDIDILERRLHVPVTKDRVPGQSPPSSTTSLANMLRVTSLASSKQPVPSEKGKDQTQEQEDSTKKQQVLDQETKDQSQGQKEIEKGQRELEMGQREFTEGQQGLTQIEQGFNQREQGLNQREQGLAQRAQRLAGDRATFADERDLFKNEWNNIINETNRLRTALETCTNEWGSLTEEQDRLKVGITRRTNTSAQKNWDIERADFIKQRDSLTDRLKLCTYQRDSITGDREIIAQERDSLQLKLAQGNKTSGPMNENNEESPEVRANRQQALRICREEREQLQTTNTTQQQQLRTLRKRVQDAEQALTDRKRQFEEKEEKDIDERNKLMDEYNKLHTLHEDNSKNSGCLQEGCTAVLANEDGIFTVVNVWTHCFSHRGNICRLHHHCLAHLALLSPNQRQEHAQMHVDMARDAHPPPPSPPGGGPRSGGRKGGKPNKGQPKGVGEVQRGNYCPRCGTNMTRMGTLGKGAARSDNLTRHLNKCNITEDQVSRNPTEQVLRRQKNAFSRVASNSSTIVISSTNTRGVTVKNGHSAVDTTRTGTKTIIRKPRKETKKPKRISGKAAEGTDDGVEESDQSMDPNRPRRSKRKKPHNEDDEEANGAPSKKVKQ